MEGSRSTTSLSQEGAWCKLRSRKDISVIRQSQQGENATREAWRGGQEPEHLFLGKGAGSEFYSKNNEKSLRILSMKALWFDAHIKRSLILLCGKWDWRLGSDQKKKD